MDSVATTETDEELQETTTTEETLLQDLSESMKKCHPYTIFDYLSSSINLDVPKEALIKIMIDRDVDWEGDVAEIDVRSRQLCIADLYVWACMGQSRKGSVSDTDNGWTHTDGGYTLSSEDKNLLLNKANAIYTEYDEPTVGGTKIKIQSRGIRKADTTLSGCYRRRYNDFL